MSRSNQAAQVVSRRCKWISWDSEGRPSCEHGRAVKRGDGRWRCREKHYRNRATYLSTPMGRARHRASDRAHRRRKAIEKGNQTILAFEERTGRGHQANG